MSRAVGRNTWSGTRQLTRLSPVAAAASPAAALIQASVTERRLAVPPACKARSAVMAHTYQGYEHYARKRVPCRITHCLDPASKAPLSISSGWRKKKHGTTTDDNGYRKWRAFIAPSPGLFPACPNDIKTTKMQGRLQHARSVGTVALRNAARWPIASPIPLVANNCESLRRTMSAWP